jgi:hypothetical protein
MIWTSCPDERLQSGMIMFQQCIELEIRLNKFNDAMISDSKSPTFWPVRGTSKSAGAKSPHDAITAAVETAEIGEYEFTDIATALNMILLWAMQVVLWSGLVHLYVLINTLQRALGLEHNAPGWDQRFTKFIIPARNVIQSAGYFLRHQPSARIAVAPLAMVMDTLVQWPDGGYDKEIDAAHEMLQIIMVGGMRLVKYLEPYGRRTKETVSPNYVGEVHELEVQ